MENRTKDSYTKNRTLGEKYDEKWNKKYDKKGQYSNGNSHVAATFYQKIYRGND